MKATEVYRAAAELYMEEVSGAKLVSIPEIGLDFMVLPQQPAEGGYMAVTSEEEYSDIRLLAIRFIACRAKTKEGRPLFDDREEREAWRNIMSEQCPTAFDNDVASRVIDEITSAFPSVSVEEAGNESEETASSDSTSTLPKSETVPLTT